MLKKSMLLSVFLCSTVFFVSCSDDGSIDKEPVKPIKKLQWEKKGAGVENVRELLAVNVNSSSYMTCAIENIDKEVFVYGSKDSGLSWNKIASTSFDANYIMGADAKGWSCSSVGLKSLNPDRSLLFASAWGEDKTSGELAVTKRGSRLVYLNEGSTEGVFVGGDKSVHKVSANVELEPEVENVDRVTNVELLSEEFVTDAGYNPIWGFKSKVVSSCSLSESNIWAGGFDTKDDVKYPNLIYKDANAWKNVYITTSKEGEVSQLSFADAKNGYAVVSSAENSFTYNMLYKTTDGGATWSVLSDVKDSVVISSIALENESTAYYAAGGQVYRTVDGGTTWKAFEGNEGVEKLVFKDEVLYGFSKTGSFQFQ